MTELTVWRITGRTDWLPNRLTNNTDWLIECRDWLTVCWTDWLTDWLTDWMTDGRTADGLTDRLMDGPTDRLTDGRTDQQTDGRTNWQMNCRLTSGQTKGRTDWLINGWTDGRTDGRRTDWLTNAYGRSDGHRERLLDGRIKNLIDWINLLTDWLSLLTDELTDGMTNTQITQIHLLCQVRKLRSHQLKRQQKEAKLTTKKTVKRIFPPPTCVSDTLHMQSMLIRSFSLGVKTVVASSTFS